MVCKCGGGCKTRRCECKEKGKSCSSRCGCHSDLCTNRQEKGCSCGPQSECIRCDCRRNNEFCDEEYCGCNSSKCTNKRVVNSRNRNVSHASTNAACSLMSLLTSNEPVVNYYDSPKSRPRSLENDGKEFNDYASELTKQIRLDISGIRDQVIDYRDGKDLYTKQNAREYTKVEHNPHVDHIIECQMLGHATAKVLYQNVSKGAFIEPLKGIVNQYGNYNVTHGAINESKGSIIKNYLRQKKYEDKTLREVVLDAKGERYFAKYVNNITSEMSKSGDIILNDLEEVRRDDNHVSGRGVFKEIEESLSDILQKMDLNPEDGRKLRSSKK